MPEPAQDGTSPSPTDAPRRSLAEDYAAIEDALAATPRGRWFLAEYARRNRTAETEMLLEAIGKLEAAVLKPQQKAGAPCGVFADLVEMSDAISRTRPEIAQIKPPFQFDQQLVNASEELDHIVEATEKATSDILAAAEDIQEVAWTLRERGPRSRCATRSISARPISTPPARSRTSPDSAPTRWCARSASSRAASTR